MQDLCLDFRHFYLEARQKDLPPLVKLAYFMDSVELFVNVLVVSPLRGMDTLSGVVTLSELFNYLLNRVLI